MEVEVSNEKIISEIGRHWLLFLIMGIFAVIAGIYFAMNFGAGFAYIAYKVSLYFLVSGILSLYIAIQCRGIPGWPLKLILSIISVIIGIMVLSDYFTSGALGISGFMLLVLSGAGLISGAASLIAMSIGLRKQFGSSWILILILGILQLIMACTVAANPILLITYINVNVSVSVLSFGIMSIIIALRLKKIK